VKTIKVKYLFPEKLRDWFQRSIEAILKPHYSIEVSDNPDYLFAATHDDQYLRYDCIRILFAVENVTANFNLCDYAIGLNHIHFEDRYLRYPFYLFYDFAIKQAEMKHCDIDLFCLSGKKKFCNFIVSNGNADEERSRFFDLLSHYKSVDSGGAYKNNIGRRVENKFQFQKEYKFSICFENSSTSGYLTEKLIEAAAAKTIPIYWGDPNATKSLYAGGGGINAKAIINVHDFNSFEDVVSEISRIDQSDELFIKMLKEPLFLEADHVEILNVRLEAFLKSIFDNSLSSAIRRGNGVVQKKIEIVAKQNLKLQSTSELIKEVLKRMGKKLQEYV
jgi:hypothetical protein